MNIVPLADMPEAIPSLARWFYDEWHQFDGRSVAAIQTQLAANLNRDRVPITFVACDRSELLGTASLDQSDLPGFDHFSPWLASLYVRPSARSKGVGTALVHHVQHFACSCAIGEIYLWSPGSIRLYERCGGTTIGNTIYNTRPITLMRFRCEAAAPDTVCSQR